MSRRARIVIRGAVQGVGFRPFVYRLASELGLAGWVSNSAQGVFIEAEGAGRAVEDFLLRLSGEKPPLQVTYRLTPLGRRFIRILDEVQRLQDAIDRGRIPSAVRD